MGADGGVCWVRLKTPKIVNPLARPPRERFLELVRPFTFDYYDSSRSEHAEWDTASSNGEYLYSTYGTDHDVQGYNDLEEVLRELPEVDPHWGDSIFTMLEVDPDATFVDLLTAYCTEPAWREPLSGTLMAILRFVTRCRNRDSISAIKKAADDPVFSMPVREWAKEIRDLIEPRSFGYEETWT